MKTFKFLLLFLACQSFAMAQFCGISGPTVCTPDSSLAAPGITPFATFPCITKGVAFSNAFQLYVPTVFSGATIDSIHIDSITNLPCGLCWSNDRASRWYHGGERGCFLISGTSGDSAGVYNIDIFGRIFVHVGSTGLSTTGSLSQYWSSFYVTVINPGDQCSHAVPAQTLNNCQSRGCALNKPDIIQLNTTGCNPDTVKLGTSINYNSYKWIVGFDTLYTSTINVLQPGGYVQLYVTDTANCTGQNFTSVFQGSGPLNPPTVCYVSADTNLTQRNMILAFEKDNNYNNVAEYILIGLDTSGDSHPYRSLSSVTAPGYFRDTVLPYFTYYISAVSACGDTTYSLYNYSPSQLTVDTSGIYPVLNWPLQSPYNYSAIKVWGRAAGGYWHIKDTIYSNNVVSLSLSYTDTHPDSTVMEYRLSYDISGSCDPSRSTPTAFTNIARSAPERTTTGVNDIEIHAMKVYPNPATDLLNIYLPKQMAANEVKVYTVLGEMIYSGSMDNAEAKSINIADYPQGLYIVKTNNAESKNYSGQ